jgi:8-oxo-dGTP diphosphatase
MSFTYDYPRPAVTVDALVLTKTDEETLVLLIQRGNEPFAGQWALPGGFVDMDEDLEPAARRELTEETGLLLDHLEQFRTYGTPGRDPRHRTITVVFYGWVDEPLTICGADDAADARWFPVHALPAMAFDHGKVIDDAIKVLNI